jgi:hypothetical protein
VSYPEPPLSQAFTELEVVSDAAQMIVAMTVKFIQFLMAAPDEIE